MPSYYLTLIWMGFLKVEFSLGINLTPAFHISEKTNPTSV